MEFKHFTQDTKLQKYFETKEVEIKSEPCINWHEKTTNKYYKSESEKYVDRGLLNVFSINLKEISNEENKTKLSFSKYKPSDELV